MIYHITHYISGRNKSLEATSWKEVEQLLIKLGLYPDDWLIVSIEPKE